VAVQIGGNDAQAGIIRSSFADNVQAGIRVETTGNGDGRHITVSDSQFLRHPVAILLSAGVSPSQAVA
jgi:hypothetical protein